MTGQRARSAFTVLETLIAMSVLATASILVAQTATWSLAERGQTEDRLAAIEATANVLEEARARPWRDVTPEWAARVKLSDELTTRLPEAVLTVRVAPEAGRDRVKRVAVELKWAGRFGREAPPVTLVGLFADRTAGGGT